MITELSEEFKTINRPIIDVKLMPEIKIIIPCPICLSKNTMSDDKKVYWCVDCGKTWRKGGKLVS